MNKSLYNLIFFSATLLTCQAGAAADLADLADLAVSAGHALAQPTIAMTNTAVPAPATNLTMASIGEAPLRAGPVRTAAAAAAEVAVVRPDKLPSTPIALACLVLVIGILVSRRNANQSID